MKFLKIATILLSLLITLNARSHTYSVKSHEKRKRAVPKEALTLVSNNKEVKDYLKKNNNCNSHNTRDEESCKILGNELCYPIGFWMSNFQKLQGDQLKIDLEGGKHSRYEYTGTQYVIDLEAWRQNKWFYPFYSLKLPKGVTAFLEVMNTQGQFYKTSRKYYCDVPDIMKDNIFADSDKVLVLNFEENKSFEAVRYLIKFRSYYKEIYKYYQEYTTYFNQLQTCKSKLQLLENNRASLEAQLTQAYEDLARYNQLDMNSPLIQAAIKKDKEAQSLSNKIAELEKRLNELQIEERQKLTEENSQKDLKEQKRIQILSAERRKITYVNKKIEYESTRQQKTTLKTQIDGQITNLEAENKNSEALVIAYNKEIERLKSLISKENAKVTTNKGIITEKTNQMTTLVTEIDSLSTKITTTTTSIETETKVISDSYKDIKNIDAKLVTIREELDKIKTEIAEKTEERNTSMNQLKLRIKAVTDQQRQMYIDNTWTTITALIGELGSLANTIVSQESECTSFQNYYTSSHTKYTKVITETQEYYTEFIKLIGGKGQKLEYESVIQVNSIADFEKTLEGHLSSIYDSIPCNIAGHAKRMKRIRRKIKKM